MTQATPAEFVANARNKLGLTFSQLGAATGISGQTWSKFEKGHKKPSKTALMCLRFMLSKDESDQTKELLAENEALKAKIQEQEAAIRRIDHQATTLAKEIADKNAQLELFEQIKRDRNALKESLRVLAREL